MNFCTIHTKDGKLIVFEQYDKDSIHIALLDKSNVKTEFFVSKKEFCKLAEFAVHNLLHEYYFGERE